MIVNTRKGTLKLTKRERDGMQATLDLLVQIEKCGTGKVADQADVSASQLGHLMELMTPVEEEAAV